MSLDPVRKAVLIDMAYEIGGKGLAQFSSMLGAIREGQWMVAAIELKQSLLFRQVQKREQENAEALASGIWPQGIGSVEELVKRHEGCVLTGKPDAKGKWEIGWGHDILAPGPGEPPPTCLQLQADSWFEQDLELAKIRAQVDLGPGYWGS